MGRAIKSVRKEGHTTVIAVGGLLPADWRFVTIEKVEKKSDIQPKNDDIVYLKIERVQ